VSIVSESVKMDSRAILIDSRGSPCGGGQRRGVRRRVRVDCEAFWWLVEDTLLFGW